MAFKQANILLDAFYYVYFLPLRTHSWGFLTYFDLSALLDSKKGCVSNPTEETLQSSTADERCLLFLFAFWGASMFLIPHMVEKDFHQFSLGV